ncbi:MAG: response regulator [Verrucomicrobia bacterium]|nr:response regulator [Verrucomicrobiota bacterium]
MSTDHELPDSYHAMVLLIDDQPFVGDAVTQALAGQDDIDLHFCPDPQQALELANHLHPTVILLDLVMPQLDGLTLLKRLRANPVTAEVPIVVLSAEEEAQTKSDAFAIGANDYLVKLPDVIELRARIRYHSRAHLNRLHREEAHAALRESQQELVRKNTELSLKNEEIRQALAEVKELRGLLPICCNCKKIRDDQNYWCQIDAYLTEHTDVIFSHSLCPECYSNVMKEWHDQKTEE